MNKSRFRVLFPAFLFFLLSVPSPVHAAIPQTINYQGFLLSKITNLPVETPQDIKFLIYGTATGGMGALLESRCNVPVSKGRYEVEVGALSGGIPESFFINFTELWLEVQVDPDGDCAGTYEAMSPRIHLQASPYAFNSLYASTASAATSLFSADIIGPLAATTNGAITISTNLYVKGGITVDNILPGQKLSVAGLVESKGDPLVCVASESCGFKFPDNTIQFTAAADTKWKLNGAGEHLYTSNAGNVAIGETLDTPLARLHVSTAAGETGDVVLVTVGISNVFRVSGLGQVTAASYLGNGATLTGIVAKGGDTMTGPLTLSGSSLTITSLNGISSPKLTFQPNVAISSEASAALGGGLRVSSNVYVIGFSSAAKYYGDGSSLVGVTTTDLSKVRLTGDTMTGQLTLLNSTLTVTGAAFSVTGSTFSISGGSVAVGGLTYPARLSVTGGILATSSITAQAGLYSNLLTLTQGITASSASFSNSGAANYSIDTASGIKVNAGAVTAPYFIGNGSELTNVAGTDINRVLKAGDSMSGNLLMSGSSITIVASGGLPYSLTVASAAVVTNYSLAVAGTGNVGVQVSNPNAPLEVYKQILISNTPAPGGDASLSLLGNGGLPYMNWTDTALGSLGTLGFPLASRDLVYRAGGATPASGGLEVFRISAGAAGAGWQFGIGTDSANTPKERFHVRTNVLVSTSGFVSPILYISTAAGTVSISTVSLTHALTVNGGILAVSSITAQGFFGDGSGITNISQGGLQMAVSSISARSDSPYMAVVFTSDTYVNAKLAVGQVFTPSADLHVRGIVNLDQKNTGESVILNLFPHDGGAAYINWTEGATPTKGNLGMPSGLRDLIFNINTTNEEVFRVKGNSTLGGGPGWQFGIGTPNPLAPFHVATNLLVSSAAANPILFISTSQAAVGIWTTTPAERFNVASTMLVGSKASPLIYASTATNYTGIGTASPRAMLEVGNGNLLAAGAYTGVVSSPSVNGPASLFMWVPSVSALRAGYIGSTEWNTLGLYSVAFGYLSNATGNASVVSGGNFNYANGDYSVISGGRSNSTLGQSAAIGGGENNYIFGKNSVIPGGEYNAVYSVDSFVGGRNGYLDAAAQGTFMWGYDDNGAHGLGIANTFQITEPYVFLIDPANVKGYKVGIRTPSPQAALDVNGDAQFGAGVNKSTFTAGGYWAPRWMNSAAIQAAAPGAIGLVIGNSDIKDLCISTGAAAGNWALVGSKGGGGCYP